QSFEPVASIIMAVIVWILVVVTLFFLDESSVGKHLIFTELNDGGEDDTPAKRLGAMQETLNEPSLSDMLALRCAALSEELHLTPREHEILELLARGRSKAYIADAFFISENTVRGHVKRLYVKLDVHSKQELVDKVESVAPRT
ncbi:MAG: LuxR C-terminal-related transcriptional regulator, partial [Raoultibacter sp.]